MRNRLTDIRLLSVLAIFTMAGCVRDDDYILVGVVDHPENIQLLPVDGVPGVAIKVMPRTCVYASGLTRECDIRTMARTEVER